MNWVPNEWSLILPNSLELDCKVKNRIPGREKNNTLIKTSLFNAMSDIFRIYFQATTSVRSVGYSDLFVLSKKDMWDVLKDYPAARVRLEAIAVKRLEKYKKAPLEKGKLPLCWP